jgi:hypothetical protein
MDQIFNYWEALHARTIYREVFGLLSCLTLFIAVEFAEQKLHRRSRESLDRWESVLTAMCACWMWWAFRRVFYMPVALAICIAGLYLAMRRMERLRKSGPADELQARLLSLFKNKRDLFWTGIILAPIFWDEGSLFGGGWRYNMIGPVLSHALAKPVSDLVEKRFGKRRFRFKGGRHRSVEAAGAYLLVSLLVQFPVYLFWCQIPLMWKEPRAFLWAVAGAGAAVLSDLYVPEDSDYLYVPLITAAAMYVYGAA